MKDSLKPGLSATRRVEIDAKRTISFMGEDLRVYATPELVRDIEATCLELIAQHADAGESSVGIAVDINHAGATPLGSWVEITVTVSAVEGRQVAFDVVARDPIEEVSRGSHRRFVVEVEKLKGRLAGKVAKIKELG